MDCRPRTPLILWVSLGLLLVASALLAWIRIYQVDEAQNLYMARIIAMGTTREFFTNAPLWMVGPMAWLTRAFPDSASIFTGGRCLFLVVFWANGLLLATCTGERLGSKGWIVALLLAMTLAPMWDYGFEIRHDNLLLTGLLASWWLARLRPRSLPGNAILGALAVLMLFVAFKAFVFVVPLSIFFLVFPHPGSGHPWPLRYAAWFGGALGMAALCLMVYRASGLWPVYVAGWKGGLTGAVEASRVNLWLPLQRPITQTPLLLALVAAALAQAPLVWKGASRTTFWDGFLPETALFLIVFAAFLINPTPFPYNLVNLVPFGFLLAYKFAKLRLEELVEKPGMASLAVCLVLFTWIVPFLHSTWRHAGMRNDRQEKLMDLAERMTDPAKDRVYDATGMVITRRSIHFKWYLHSLNIRSFVGGGGPDLPAMLQAQPAAVLIPSYRTDWLRKEDWDFIRGRYLPLADDFYVLGRILEPGGSEVRIHHPGRYLILGLQGGRIGPLSQGELDGQPAPDRPVHLETGVHRLLADPGAQPIVAWVGPNLETLPVVGTGHHLLLFQNWY